MASCFVNIINIVVSPMEEKVQSAHTVVKIGDRGLHLPAEKGDTLHGATLVKFRHPGA